MRVRASERECERCNGYYRRRKGDLECVHAVVIHVVRVSAECKTRLANINRERALGTWSAKRNETVQRLKELNVTLTHLQQNTRVVKNRNDVM